MTDILKSIFCYGFHDTDINSITIKDDEIIIYFSDGLYTLDSEKNENKLLHNLRMIVKTKIFHKGTDATDNINVWDSRYGDVDTIDFLNKLLTSQFGIDNLYYSPFNSTILIDGFYNNESNFEKGISQKIIILIENCLSVQYYVN